ncbi:MAG TPA: lysylphosphatidylglycerol synthase domain-containing protein, partial [Dehalococcoidia bacterium]|nr:lysylphosphatidylglycerol synthase domain-containing protein [Dehalococcoidia bacterium]
MTHSAQAALGFGVTALFIVLAVRNVDWAAVGASLAAADYRYVGAAALLTLLGYGVRALRWQQVLRPLKVIPLR